ncbi:urease accessory protein UreE [Roseivivax halodurans JCM 10272]|uniref:Urease accessory protein UreE n=1 Tax=Roseivivax halodurans JCM 10272 TaxID=1449350 RepID=X7EH30_9RHOB|nr:urease accessory protein UreE [Roseivivax halodurans]ETX15247.1 urease accessory protein UreE [Roseivivax halodurans JCM 10272]
MSAPDLVSRHVHPHAHAEPAGRVSLDYEARFLRRKVLTLEDGRRLLVDLPHTTSLDHGSVLVAESGEEIAVDAAPEPLLAVTGNLTRLAWHIGNRHTPCQIEEDRLLIRRDHVMSDMLARIGAEVTEIVAPFTPEGGAYGHGRTHGHDHSHAQGPDGHSHSHAHEH